MTTEAEGNGSSNRFRKRELPEAALCIRLRSASPASESIEMYRPAFPPLDAHRIQWLDIRLWQTSFTALMLLDSLQDAFRITIADWQGQCGQ